MISDKWQMKSDKVVFVCSHTRVPQEVGGFRSLWFVFPRDENVVSLGTVKTTSNLKSHMGTTGVPFGHTEVLVPQQTNARRWSFFWLKASMHFFDFVSLFWKTFCLGWGGGHGRKNNCFFSLYIFLRFHAEWALPAAYVQIRSNSQAQEPHVSGDTRRLFLQRIS